MAVIYPVLIGYIVYTQNKSISFAGNATTFIAEIKDTGMHWEFMRTKSTLILLMTGMGTVILDTMLKCRQFPVNIFGIFKNIQIFLSPSHCICFPFYTLFLKTVVIIIRIVTIYRDYYCDFRYEG